VVLASSTPVPARYRLISSRRRNFLRGEAGRRSSSIRNVGAQHQRAAISMNRNRCVAGGRRACASWSSPTVSSARIAAVLKCLVAAVARPTPSAIHKLPSPLAKVAADHDILDHRGRRRSAWRLETCVLFHIPHGCGGALNGRAMPFNVAWPDDGA